MPTGRKNFKRPPAGHHLWECPPDGMRWIYVLRDPRTQAIRYVGQTSRSLAKRAIDHPSDPGEAKQAWLVELEGIGLRPLAERIDCVTARDVWFMERWWIDYLGARFPLVNCAYLRPNRHRSVRDVHDLRKD